MKNKLKVCRAELNMTQQDVASHLGITRQTVIAIEKGKYSPSLELAFKIARMFQKNVEEIFFYENSPD